MGDRYRSFTKKGPALSSGVPPKLSVVIRHKEEERGKRQAGSRVQEIESTHPSLYGMYYLT